MARIRVNTEDLKNKAKDFDSAAEACKRAGDDILAAAMAMPSYDGQLSGPARKAGYEIQKQARELSTDLAGNAESFRKAAQAFEEVDNQAVDTFDLLCASLSSSQHQLRLAGEPEIHGDHTLGYEIDYENNTIKIWYMGKYVVFNRDDLGEYEANINAFMNLVGDYEAGYDMQSEAILALLGGTIGIVVYLIMMVWGDSLRYEAIKDATTPWNLFSDTSNNDKIIESGDDPNYIPEYDI